MHVYGEIATDKKHHLAFLNGLIASVDPSVDVGMLYRRIDKKYQSLYGNAFTENSLPTNENGLYMALSLRPVYGLKMDAYADLFTFPWLKFATDAPGYGSDYLIQITYTPSKQIEIYFKYKIEAKQSNVYANQATNQIVFIPRQTMRSHISYQINREILLRSRVEVLWYDKKTVRRESGYLAYIDFNYKSYSKSLSGNTRIQYFETDGYNSRLYAYENDVMYANTTPAVFEKGFRWYINVRTDVSRWLLPLKKTGKIEAWVRYAITKYMGIEKIGSGLDEIKGNTRSEFKFQFIFPDKFFNLQHF